MEERFDIVIIGSGLGGLICANILSRKGYKVAVLEKNTIPGGCLQSFKRKHVEFDTGIHYVGSLSSGQRQHQLFKYLKLIPGLKYRQLDTNGFDKLLIGDKEISYAQGHKNYVEKLTRSFPQERIAIQKFSSKIIEVADSVDLYNLKPVTGGSNKFFEKLNFGSTWNYITQITKNKELQNVFAGLNMLYAGKKESSLLFMHSLIYNGYIESAYRFVDGTNQITNLLIKRLLENGGQIFTNEEVIQLNVKEKNIESVSTKSGMKFFVNKVISGIHPQNTLKMLNPDRIRKTYKNRINNIKNTSSSFALYLVLKKNKVPYMNHNQYIYPNGDVWAGSEYNPELWPEGCAVYPIADSRDMEYTRGVTVLTLMSMEEFLPWINTSVDARGKSYDELKEEKSQRLISFLKKHMPLIGNNIDFYYASTPLTYRDYTGTPDGSIYGVERDFRNPLESFIFPKTKVPNLLFTGQNIMIHGMLGVSMGALLTCSEILDINELLVDINKA